jgi:hypothetical protein
VDAIALPAPLSTRAVAALEAIELVGCEDLPPQQVVEEIVHRITRAIDADVFCAGPTDPDTGLYVGAGLSCNITDLVCSPIWEQVWEQKFLVPDYNRFADLTAADPVGDLRQATGGKLSRSARYRTLNAVADLEDELRAVLHAGGRSWGKLQLNRHTGAKPFTEAEAWLHKLTPGYRKRSTLIGIHPELLLMPLRTLTEPGVLPRRIRLRTLTGTWLAAHASSLAGSGRVAIVIEPANASEIASIVVEAYRLTGREVQVARLVAQGLSTNEIASTLFLSRHTVRDPQGHLSEGQRLVPRRADLKAVRPRSMR